MSSTDIKSSTSTLSNYSWSLLTRALRILASGLVPNLEEMEHRTAQPQAWQWGTNKFRWVKAVRPSGLWRTMQERLGRGKGRGHRHRHIWCVGRVGGEGCSRKHALTESSLCFKIHGAVNSKSSNYYKWCHQPMLLHVLSNLEMNY